MPVLGAFTAAAGPQAQDVAFPVHGNADHVRRRLVHPPITRSTTIASMNTTG